MLARSAPRRDLRRWARRTRARALFAFEEWKARAEELSEEGVSKFRQRFQSGGARPSAQSGSSLLNSRLEQLSARWQQVNRDFDGWFNASCQRLQGRAEERVKEWKRQWAQRSAKAGKVAQPPLDTSSVTLIGLGAGCVIQEHLGFGLVLATIGTLRAAGRFVVSKVDAGDVDGLFKWVPASLNLRKDELFFRLRREIDSFRAIRSGNHSDLSWINHRGRTEAMHAEFDYTPEQLFGDAMSAIAAHPRVQEVVGQDVKPVAEPDKVVYRIHEGVAEVALAWRVRGASGAAEVQVKSTASLMDFIYVFPEAHSRYGMSVPGFVIRPNSDWSQEVKEMPRHQKQPFGGPHNGRLFVNREAIFEYDWEVRDFRTGWEGGRRGR